MKTILVFFCALLTAHMLSAQDCTPAQYQKMLKEADQAVKRGEYDLAINKLQSAKVCQPGKEGEVSEKILKVFEKVNGERRAAIRNAEEARRQKEKAEAETRRIYANDLAFKSQTALKDGDRTTAFRLAEFAHLYVDEDNDNVTRALFNAFYCNEDSNKAYLPWIEQTFYGQEDSLSKVIFSTDGERLIIVSKDRVESRWDINIWGVNSRQKIKNISSEGHLYAIGFSSDVQQVATVTSHHGAISIDSINGSKYYNKSFYGDSFIGDIIYSPNGMYLATKSGGRAEIWDLYNEKILLSRDSLDWDYADYDIDFSSDGRHLAIGTLHGAEIWNLINSKIYVALTLGTSKVFDVSFSPDGKYLATGSSEKTSKIWNIETGKEVASLGGYNSDVRSVMFSINGNYLASWSSNNTIKIWDVHRKVEKLATEGGSLISFSPNGRWFAAISIDKKTVKIWDVESGKEIFILKGHTANITGIAFSQNCKRFATISDDKTTKIWSLIQTSLPNDFKKDTLDITNTAFSPDGKFLAIGYEDKTIKISNLKNEEFVVISKSFKSGITDIAFSPNGKLLAISLSDSTIIIWDIESNKEALEFKGHSSISKEVLFLKDKIHIAIGSKETLEIWDLNDKKQIFVLNANEKDIYKDIYFDYIRKGGFAISPDGKSLAIGYIASIGGGGNYMVDGIVRVWSFEKSKEKLISTGKSLGVKIVFSPNGKLIAIGSDDKSVKVINLETLEEVIELKVNFYIIDLAFSSTGSNFITYSADGVITVWNVTTGIEIISSKSASNKRGCLDITADGKSIVFTRAGNNNLMVQEIDPGNLIQLSHQNRIGVITPDQISLYNLKEILDLLSESETNLILTHENIQIKAFADFNAQKVRKSMNIFNVTNNYARAQRLYQYVLNGKIDSSLMNDFGHLYTLRANTILESTRPDTALNYARKGYELNPNSEIAQEALARALFAKPSGQRIETERDQVILLAAAEVLFKDGKFKQAISFYEKTEGLKHKAETLLHWYECSEKTKQKFDFQRFLNILDSHEIKVCGDYFYNKGNWKVAGKLYEKIGAIYYEAEILIKWYECSEKMEQQFDFQQFLTIKNIWGLQKLAEYFYNRKNWKAAGPLYEKMERLEHKAETMLRLYECFEKTGDHFDFQRFLVSDNVLDLRTYAQYFAKTKKWKEAVCLFTKAEQINHETNTLIWLHYTSIKMGQNIDFQQFLASSDVIELRHYADYFYNNLFWIEAGQLYEKLQKMQPRSETLLRWYECAEKSGQEFDFQNFLKIDDTDTLLSLANYFIGKKRWSNALHLLHKYCAIMPERPVGICSGYLDFLNGRLALDDQDTLLAVNFFKMAVSSTQGVNKAWAYYYLAKTLLEEERYEEFDAIVNIANNESKGFDDIIALNLILISKSYQKRHDEQSALAALDAIIGNYTGKYLHNAKQEKEILYFSNINTLILSNNLSELQNHGNYLYSIGKWSESKLFYEKSDSLKHTTEIILQLHRISEKTGEEFDFQRFLISKDTSELLQYASYFAQKGDSTLHAANITPLRNCLLICDTLLAVQNNYQNRKLVARYCDKLAWNLFFTGDAIEAESIIRQGMKLDPENYHLSAELPHSLLLQGKIIEAQKEYVKRAGLPANEKIFRTYRDLFENDFKIFNKVGLKIEGLEKVRTALEKGRN